MRTFALPLGLLLFLGCDLVPQIAITEFVDEGQLCFNSGGELIVDWQTCLSSSCDTLIRAECTGILNDGVLTIESYGMIESIGGTCTDDCGFSGATCAVPVIDDRSTVTVQHGATSVALNDVGACVL